MRIQRKIKPFLRPAVVSCLCLAVLLICFSSFMLKKTTGTFRPEIKKVYRNVSMGTCDYDKTMEIMNTVSMGINSVKLNDIDGNALKELLNKDYGRINAPENKSGTKYYLNGNFFQKYEDGRLVWETAIQMKYYRCHIILDSGILVVGNIGSDRLHVVLMDNYGNIRWEYLSESVMDAPAIAFSEGIIHVVGHNHRDGVTELTILRLDMNGNLISKKTKIFDGYVLIKSSAVIGDHYVVQAYRNGNREMLKLSFEGEMSDKTVFKLDGMDCIIKDILHHDGKLYVSAVFINRPTDTFDSEKITPLYEEGQAAYEAEGFGEGNQNYDFEMGEEYNKRLTKVFREQYTASLLILDVDGSVSGVYTVEGGYCGSLSYSGQGELLWQVFRIDHAKIAIPPTNCTAYIYSTEYSFCFGNESLLKQNEIGNVVDWDKTLFQ